MIQELTNSLTKWCEIDLNLLAHNIEETKKLISANTKIMAVVKDQAYGHGDLVIAKEMEQLGIDYFAVSHMEEAIRLRTHGIRSNILILTYTAPTRFEQLLQYNLTQALISFEYAKKLNSFCQTNQCCCNAHIKIDTGMHRLGLCYYANSTSLASILNVYQMSNLKITGIYTHFAVADCTCPEDISYTTTQYQLFEHLIQRLKEHSISPGITHTQNTPSTLQYPGFQCDYVRVGTLLLGLPYGDIAFSPQAKNFHPILSLKAKISMVKTLSPGSKLSYGLNYTTSKTEQIAIVAIGYGDGYPRYLSNRQVHVIIHGQLAEVIGNICMDQLIIHITSIPNVKEGDTVTLIGSTDGYTISLDYIATMMNTLSNEIADHINPRVPRVYRKDDTASVQFLTF